MFPANSIQLMTVLGVPIEVFKSNCRWLSGPDFLRQSTDEWPFTKIVEVSDDDVEVLKKQVCRAASCNQSLSRLLTYFSSWWKLQRSFAWLIRLVKLLQFKSNTAFSTNFITLFEIKNTVRKIVELVQIEYFSDEMSALTNHKKIKSNSRLVNLNPVVKMAYYALVVV